MGSMYSAGHKESYKQTFGSKASRQDLEEQTNQMDAAPTTENTAIKEEPELELAAAV